MEHPHHSEQKDLDARSFTLRDFSAQFLEQPFDVRPSNIGRDWPSVDQFDGALMFAFHGHIVSIVSTNNKGNNLSASGKKEAPSASALGAEGRGGESLRGAVAKRLSNGLQIRLGHYQKSKGPTFR